uniref:Kinesin motor domain-containing protein n=1 Tax=Amphilophus citrinellus TaxID=61819 RepID=A0A3Q0QWM8_AMPCI
DSFKMENSAVTVAVRVRPFKKSLQVIFMNGQETVQMVYVTLAKPLLLREFEGYNTCLFAYGQTGSGKSYTMMGFEEEAGVISRFFQELFSKLASMKNEEVNSSYTSILNYKQTNKKSEFHEFPRK